VGVRREAQMQVVSGARENEEPESRGKKLPARERKLALDRLTQTIGKTQELEGGRWNFGMLEQDRESRWMLSPQDQCCGTAQGVLRSQLFFNSRFGSNLIDRAVKTGQHAGSGDPLT